jgi:selenocysteine-specific elongation factor
MSLIIAVAGHIDHGKTALVRALTGIETDRLPEERQRGISIEAGFAHWRRAKTDDQPRVSFVDVPGHERYIGNMLAGIQGARAALLVVAADDGVMPQTREHAEILSLMGVRNWVVALTKSDLLDAAQLAHRIASVQTWLTSEAINAEVIPVSAHTGAGIALLTSRIEVLALIEQRRTEPDTEPKTEHTARLCVDKSFIASGDGLVVTGLLISGVLRVGDTVRVSPSGQAARVRGLQVAGQAVGEARSGSRCAINLAGSGIDRQSRACRQARIVAHRVRTGSRRRDPSINPPTRRHSGLCGNCPIQCASLRILCPSTGGRPSTRVGPTPAFTASECRGG